MSFFLSPFKFVFELIGFLISAAFVYGLALIVAITIIAVLKYNQMPNIPTMIGIALIVIGVVVVNLMNDIDVK